VAPAIAGANGELMQLHRLGAGFKPRRHLQQGCEARLLLGPRYSDLLHPVFVALDAGDLCHQEGLELAGI